MNKKISIIGAGAWGTTLAILLAEKGHDAVLWAYEKELAGQINQMRENKTFLPGIQINEKISATNIPEDTKESDIYIFVVPTQHLRTIAKQFSKFIKSEQIVVAASKGIEQKTLQLPTQILKEELKTNKIAALSGPNLSAEIVKGLPAAAVAAAEDQTVAKAVQEAFMLERFRVYVNTDPIGVQLGGALKNIIAIAAGAADGLDLGNNAKSSLLIRGIAEISRLGIAIGAKPQTFTGLSGMGDLITTCASNLSRNHWVGAQIAQGKKLPDILKNMKNIAEGVFTCKAALDLAKKHKVELPVTKEVYAVLYKDKNPLQSINDLMTRSATSE